MLSFSKWWCLVFIVCCLACVQPKKQIMLLSIEDAQQLKGYAFDELGKLELFVNGQPLLAKDSILEGEGETWSALVYLQGSTPVLTIENSWANRKEVSSIMVTSSALKTQRGVGVGSSYENLANFIAFDSWVRFPDGVIAFKDKRNSQMAYIMNTNDYEELLYAPLDKASFPKEMEVAYIAIYMQ